MKKNRFLFITLIFILTACSTTKNIPEGSYLLDGFTIKHDTKNATSDLEDFVRQQPNTTLPLLGKLGLKIYNIAGQDSTWINKIIWKIGQAPVIYSPSQTQTSKNQLLKQMNNQGYLNAEADTTLKIKGNKIAVTYNLKGGTPYLIRDYKYTISDTTMARIMSRMPMKPYLNGGDMFDVDMMEEERLRVNNIMRNFGYYNFSKEYVYFKADTTLNSHQVDLFLDVYPAKDSLPYPQYRINNVTVVSGINSLTDRRGGDGQLNTNRWFFRNADTVDYKGIKIIHGRNNFLRNSTIARNNFLRKGSYFSDYALNGTYEAYSKMVAIKQANISVTPSAEDSTRLLDATIILLPANAHWFKAGLDGTNSAGDVGVAPSVSYQHQNLFNGGEQFYIKLKGAYEFIAGKKDANLMSSNYYEYGVETGISFPMFLFPWLKKAWREQPSASTKVSVGLTDQHRQEYTRQFFNTTLNYGWTTKRNRLRHALDLLDINYIRMPYVSHTFDSIYLNNPKNPNPLLKESYRDQLVSRTAYTVTLVNGRRLNSSRPTYTLRGSIEVAGALPRLATTINGAKKDEKTGQKKILGVAYAEYVKGSMEYSQTFSFSKVHSVAYRIGLGMAHPYGNSDVLPFERRFFAGGANSIRGWSTRSLGPGSYQRPDGVRSDFVNQTGDMKFELSVENRYKLTSLIEFAQFVDAGNIWTLKDYKTQPEGQFQFKNFYKEIALSYGMGLRLDLGFLLLRLDLGMPAYDPGYDQSDRFVLLKPRLNRMALHFGIGYPF
ncbi:MAG: BamA/TamA family outer membrane protein [Prevotella sp.]|nr:BamA/TamA family outer membrane protein [Prevotella sp.]